MKQVSRRDFATVMGLGLLASACGTLKKGADDPSNTSGKVDGDQGGSKATPAGEDVAIDPPPKLTDPLLSSDVLVYSQNTLDTDTIEKIKAIKGVDVGRDHLDGLLLRGPAGGHLRGGGPGHLPALHAPGHRPDPGGLGAGRRRGDGGGPADRQAARAEGRLHAARQRDRRRPDPHRRLCAAARPHEGAPHRRGRELQVGREARHAQGQRHAGRDGRPARRRASSRSSRSTPAPRRACRSSAPTSTSAWPRPPS